MEPEVSSCLRMAPAAKGRCYRVIRELPVTVMTQWSVPYTGGYERTLAVGTEFIVASNPGPWATSVYCDAVEPRRLARALVPWRDRWQFWAYRGFCLCIQLEDLDHCCEPLGSG